MKLVQDDKICGDMPIKDLTPKTTNLGHRLVKNMRICGSGIYTYARQEAELLHLTPVPEKYKNLTTINVYRPPEVLKQYKDIFARVPIITGRHVLVTPENAKQLTVGMVGDTVDYEEDKDDGETYLYTTGTIVAGDGIDAYEEYGQLSVGYDPDIVWEEGVHKGVQYQAVLKGFHDVNHLLICKIARGGPQCVVMDSLDEYTPMERFINKHNGGEDMGIFTKIFGSVKKPLAGDSNVVSTLLQSIAVGADPVVQTQKIKEIVGDSDKEFTGYLDELSQAKNEKPEIIAKAVNIVDSYFREKLAGDAEPEKKDAKKPEAGDAESKKDDAKKPEAGDAEPKKGDAEPKKGDAEPKKDEKSAGDAIDYDLLATKIAAVMQKKVAGDAAQTSVGDIDVPITGDSKSDVITSDSFMKMIMGGN